MTILSKKKGAGKPAGEHETIEHDVTIGHAITLPHNQLQPDGISMPQDRIFVSDRNVRSHGPNLSHSINIPAVRDEKRAPQNLEHIEPAQQRGKRRHRDSPLRSRNKISRVERDRANSSPSCDSSPTHCPNQEDGGSICELGSPEVSYNSEDEYDSRNCQLSEEEWTNKEQRFERKIRKKGMIIKKMAEDGACLFRAVSDQVYGDQDMHNVVRKQCMDYIAQNEDYFSQYVTEDFKSYVSRKRLEYVHGNHIEIQAMSEMYNRTIEVYCYGTEPINTFHGTHQTDNAPIRLSYHRGVHYNSLVDPYKATIGVGLGLPGHIPGLADKNIIKEATRQSEEIHIEQAMLEDKLIATDWEATSEALEEQVARESYLQWLKDNERRNRTGRSPSAPSSSTSSTAVSGVEVSSTRSRNVGSSTSPVSSPRRVERNTPPPPSGPSTSGTGEASASVSQVSTSSEVTTLEAPAFMSQLPPDLFGLNEWDDAGIIAEVLAASQQEYLDTLKRNRETISKPLCAKEQDKAP